VGVAAIPRPEVKDSAALNAALPLGRIQRVRVFDCDGDLTNWLLFKEHARSWVSWACFQTTTFSLETEGLQCKIIPRTIGEPCRSHTRKHGWIRRYIGGQSRRLWLCPPGA